MDFALNEDQRRLRTEIIEFAQASLGEQAGANDREARFDRAGWDECARFGVLGWPFPAEYGGAGLDPLSCVVAFEALAYGCADNGLVFAINNHVWACAVYIAEHGTPQQRKQFLPGLIDGSTIGAHALTEPDVGSDALSVTTRAVEENGQYLLTGTKCFISNAPVADLFVVFAVTEPDAAPQGRLSAFIVPASTPGVRVVREIGKAGLRGTPMGEVRFEDCVIPEDYLLGAAGGGYRLFTSAMEYERGFMFAAQVGALQRVMERSVAHASARRQFGRPIAAFQGVSHPIADMRVRLELARLLLYKVGWLKREGRMAMLEAAMLKLYASEGLVDSALAALQIHGARGYVEDQPIEREVRDALAGTVYGGTSEIQRNIIASLIGLPA
ncbi:MULTISPECIES: acyl-CoA dehydrogenase family protein [unclassified Micromonospora]|uniref:acyl-CoA dehydrogenase family protein n=1 Tax=unclassified Micromonospora TaxID=2617518 RepID=UPI0034083845